MYSSRIFRTIFQKKLYPTKIWLKRFRPIVMTTLAMVAGMLPIALAQGAGAEWKNGLAWVIIGGLISSMFLTLVVVPLVYYLMERVMGKIGMGGNKRVEIREREFVGHETTFCTGFAVDYSI
jgi:HAE1 family hydrophobic/amphiphilic exporter-1